jgi:DNA-binding LytR/AlgR family response regulator
MLNCYIIDDTPSVIRQLKKFIDQTSMLHFTGATETGEEALHMMQKLKSKVDLIFLDIELPDISGLTLLDSLSKDYIIILVSGHRHFAEEAFIKGAAGYLFKPLSYDRFLAAVNKAKEMVGTKKRTVLRPPKYIYLPGGGREVRTTILTASITFIQASGSFCSIFFDDAPPFHCSLSLKHLSEVLSPPAFIQVNRSVIVNKSKIIRYDANDVFLDEKKLIFAITDKFKDAFITSLTSDGYTF